MIKKERFESAIKKGYSYNEETGIVTSPKGKEVYKVNKAGYVYFTYYVDKKSIPILVHQFGWYWVNKETVECIDHINQNKIDNRLKNLRSVTRLQNQWNQKERKGYTFYKRDNKWKAQISIKGKQTHIGYFNTEEEARNAYLKEKEKYNKLINEG